MLLGLQEETTSDFETEPKNQKDIVKANIYSRPRKEDLLPAARSLYFKEKGIITITITIEIIKMYLPPDSQKLLEVYLFFRLN